MKRICELCEEEVIAGYCINGGEEYYCTDTCLHKRYSHIEYKRLFDNGDTYWTIWD